MFQLKTRLNCTKFSVLRLKAAAKVDITCKRKLLRSLLLTRVSVRVTAGLSQVFSFNREDI